MSTARDVKKLAFTCEQCRKRKVKCDGAEPACGRCTTRKEPCEYKQSPTLIYTHSLEKRVKELEAEISDLRRNKTSTRSPDPRTPESGSRGDDASTSSKPRRFDGLKLDGKGVTTYHGSTSLFHFLDGRSNRDSSSTDGETEEERRESKQSLKINAWQQRAIESHSQVPEPFRYLIDLHWCWVQPLFNFIYRPAFTRDMVVLGPYYSHTLMNALLSHSIRWGRADPATHELLKGYDNGAMFARHSRDMIFSELRQGACTIPTIQTLLLLSAQECSLGNSAQAWVYSGIAFRLVDHLGVSFDGSRYAGTVSLSDEDIEIRRRLFWSCYFWDKIISLYLGRLPSLQQTPVSPPQRILDDSAEEELWEPHGLTYPEGHVYTPQPSHSTSCFMQMCQLSVVFNQILIHMYDPTQQNSESEMQDCILHEEISLDNWWEDLPIFLKMIPNALPDVAPPSHIVTLNALYHTFRILLYRPIFSWERSTTADLGPDRKRLQECVSSATAIIAIFNLYSHSFGENFCTLSLHYSVFIAASVFLLQAQATPSDQQARRKLEFSVEVLTRASAVNLVIGTALDLILAKIPSIGVEVHVPPRMAVHAGRTATTPSTGPMFHDLSMASEVHGRGFDDIDMTELAPSPGFLQAASSLQPVSVRVAAVDPTSERMI